MAASSRSTSGKQIADTVMVAVPLTATSPGKPGYWAQDSSYRYTYTGNGRTHQWKRTAQASF
jgi:hypothetical protein